MWTRAELKGRAKDAVTCNYWWCVLAGLILSFVLGELGGGSGASFGGTSAGTSAGAESAGSSSSMDASVILPIVLFALVIVAVVVIVSLVISFALSAFALNIFEVGGRRFFLLNATEKTTVKEFIFGFKNNYMNVVNVMFFRMLYTFLWSLLLIVPGIIKGYEYRMIPYLLAENPDMSKEEAFDISRAMMDGNKWDAFVLDLSFIGWDLLSILTCGILGIFYVNPYRHATNAELYRALKNENY